MRSVDPRTKVGRRAFLRTSAAAPAAVAIAASAFTADAWAESANLSPHVMATLTRMARDTYPHDRLADTYYVNAVAPYDAKAAADPALKAMLEQGVARLDAEATDRHGVTYVLVGWEEDRVAILRAVEHSAFFQKVRGGLVVGLYNQKEVWPKFGYEGSSAEHGGYIHRGFDDIDWLKS